MPTLDQSNGWMIAAPAIDYDVPQWVKTFHSDSSRVELPFRSWQCEVLLNQSAELLDRCMADRVRYDALRDRLTTLIIELNGIESSNTIRAEELAEDGEASLYRSRLLQADWQGDAAEAMQAASEVERLKSSEQLSSPEWNIDQITEQHRVLEQARGVDLYFRSHSERLGEQTPRSGPTGYTYINKQGLAANAPAIADPTNPIIQGPTFVARRASDLARAEIVRQRKALEVRLAVAEKQMSAHLCTTAGSREAQREIAIAQELSKKRLNAEIYNASLRRDALTNPGAAHNFTEEMAAIRLRFLRDFYDVYARLAAAAIGLKNVYGFDEELPVSNDPNGELWSFLDLVVNWHRTASSFLVRFNQRDQVMIHTVSVRLTGKLKEGGPQERKQYVVNVNPAWKTELFYPRLRGVALHVLSKTGIAAARGVFSGRVRPPQEGWTQFFSTGLDYGLVPLQGPEATIPSNIAAPWANKNTDADRTRANSSPLTQSDVPFARFGRLQQRNNVDGVELVGTVTFMNLSPFPATDSDADLWTIEVSSVSSQGENYDEHIEDIELELHIAYQEAL